MSVHFSFAFMCLLGYSDACGAGAVFHAVAAVPLRGTTTSAPYPGAATGRRSTGRSPAVAGTPPLVFFNYFHHFWQDSGYSLVLSKQ